MIQSVLINTHIFSMVPKKMGQVVGPILLGNFTLDAIV